VLRKHVLLPLTICQHFKKIIGEFIFSTKISQLPFKLEQAECAAIKELGDSCSCV